MSSPVSSYNDYNILENIPNVEMKRNEEIGDLYAYSAITAKPFVSAIICILVSVVIVVTLVGNLMVCLAVFMVRKLKQPPNYLLVSLAVADFSVGLFVMPIAFVTLFEDRWILGDVVCRLWTSADVTLCSASILNLCIITIDRYLIITKPLRYVAQRTSKVIFGYILFVWVGAFVVSATPLTFVKWRTEDSNCQVPQNQFYQIYATVIAFYAPTVIMVILYWKMLKAAKRLSSLEERARFVSPFEAGEKEMSRRKTQHGGSFMNTSDAELSSSDTCVGGKPAYARRSSTFLNVVRMPLISHSRSHQHHVVRENKARVTLGIIMTVFIVCWLPFFIIALLKSFQLITAPSWLDNLVLWLGYFNSMLNPLIYCKYNSEFRVPFREMLCCRFRTLKSVVRHESFAKKYGPLM
uniref:G_PROTEIN_RECEP_F1_2 domain-containing protein n=1 Tax=Rhabditophanes sp. KR3021 TaxID=114890 RepID=A0AC35U703_9BILA